MSYEDKFGLLGTIAVVAGAIHGKRLAIETWVMSCRAFARRIEQQTLKMLFASTGAEEVDFDFVPTAKNGPLQEFFAAVRAASNPPTGFCLRRAQFDESCPALYHTVRELRRAKPMDDMGKRLAGCFQVVFPDLREAEIPSASQETVAAWDCGSRVYMMNVIEDEFALQMDLDDSAGWIPSRRSTPISRNSSRRPDLESIAPAPYGFLTDSVIPEHLTRGFLERSPVILFD